jgi:hypothetical protein
VKSRWVRALGWLILFIVVLGISLPFVSADRFREPLRSALENALGRKVTLGRMHWNLFTGPGLRADDVTIAEDPALGNEPIAYAGSLIATPSISSLWHRRLECSSLRLEDTHVNVARSGDAANATWNFSMLARPRLLAAVPAIRLRGARVNFRMNQVKNVFYLLDTDLDIEPVASDGSDWRVHIKGQPARTDRPGRGFGSFEATARWKVQPARTGVLDLTATLENSEISDILQLLRGDDFGLQGHVAGQLTLKGEPAALALQGALRMDQLHGWEQVPPSGEAWRFNLNGTLNSIAQDMDVNATAPGAAPVLQAHLRLSRYLAGPRWGIQATLHQMPLDSLVDVARHLGSPIPTGTRLSGTADGALGYSQSEGFEGAVQIANARMTLPKAVPVEMATARVITTGDQVLLRPTTVTVGTETAAINATYLVNSDELQVNLGSKSIAYDALEKGAQALGVPVLAEVQGGHWSGELHFVRKSASAGWLGNMRLTGARLNVPGMASAGERRDRDSAGGPGRAQPACDCRRYPYRGRLLVRGRVAPSACISPDAGSRRCRDPRARMAACAEASESVGSRARTHAPSVVANELARRRNAAIWCADIGGRGLAKATNARDLGRKSGHF